MKRTFNKPSGRTGERERFRALLQSEGYRRNRDGELSNKDYLKFVTSTEDNKVVDRVLKECKGDACKNGYAFSWDDIIQWINDHWWDILKMVLTIAILFLEPKPKKGKE